MKVIVAGDYSPHYRAGELLESSESGKVFSEISPVLRGADYSIVNFETVVRTPSAAKIRKLGPHLSCAQPAVDALKDAGFDCVTLANNHFYDYGNEGVRASLDAFRRTGLQYVGGGMNLEEASRTLYVRKGEETLAVINCCEHEFSIATSTSAGSNPLDPDRQFGEIAAAAEKSDCVLVIIHGGSEYYRFPTPRMVALYRKFIDAGASAVVNHHQHCFSGYEVYRGKPIFYGLGNFCFDWPGETGGDWNRGYMVSLDFGRGAVGFDLLPYIQCSDIPSVIPVDREGAFDAEINSINRVISSPEMLRERFEALALERKRIYLKMLRPTLFFRKKKRLKEENFRNCESHADLLAEVEKRLFRKV